MPNPKIFFIPFDPVGAKPASRPRRSPARKKKPAARPRHTTQETRGWKLVVIDQEPLRQAAVQAYHQANEQLASLRERVEHHSTADQPAYGGWLAAAFGPLLTELREVEDQITDKGSLLRAVRMLMTFGGLSAQRAYREILKEKAEMERFEARAANGEDLEEDDDADFTDEEEQLFEDMPDALRKLFGVPGKADAGKPSPDEAQAKTESRRSTDHRRRTGPGAKKSNPPEQSASQRLKAAYRAVVRRLHPDLRSDLTDYDRQLWHEAQNAYEKSDLERLETILAIGEMSSSGALPVGSGLGGLLALTRQLERAVGQLQGQLRSLKKMPSWNFTLLAAGEKRKLALKAAVALRADLADAKAELTEIEATWRFAPSRRVDQKAVSAEKTARTIKKRKSSRSPCTPNVVCSFLR